MADRPHPAMDSDEEEDWGSMSSPSSSSSGALPRRSYASCIRVLGDPMDSDGGADGVPSLIATGTREDPSGVDSEDEGDVVQRIAEVLDSSSALDNLYE